MEARNNKDEARRRRMQLLADRARYVAQMSDDARRAFEQWTLQRERAKRSAAERIQPTGDPALSDGTLLAGELRKLIREAHRLRRVAEDRRELRTAMKGLDSALKALELYGRVTGAIREQRGANVTVNLVATREEGIRMATELLVDLASEAELISLIDQLQQRLNELDALQDLSKVDLPKVVPEVRHSHLLPAPALQGKEEEDIG